MDHIDAPGPIREKKYHALYRRLKEDILQGVLAPGARLPSKRALADQQGVSVITAEYAYRQLMDEGYIYARERSGYYVQSLRGMSPAPAARREPLRRLPEEAIPPEDPDFPYSLWFRTIHRRITGSSIAIAFHGMRLFFCKSSEV